MNPTSISKNSNDHNIIFVGGHSRSGTTLLQGLLCNSPSTINITRECSYFRSLVAAYQVGWQWWDYHTYDYFDSRDAFDTFNIRLMNMWFDHVADRYGPGAIVQKEPRLTQMFPELARLYPRAKFVIIVRDLRDVLASQARRAKRGVHKFNPNEDVQRFVRTFERIKNHADLFGNRLVYVRYESLLLDPNRIMGELCNQFSIEAPEGMGSWQTKRQPGEESGTDLDGRAPDRSAIGRYQSDLDTKIAQQVENLRGEIGKKVGYDCFCADTVVSNENWSEIWKCTDLI